MNKKILIAVLGAVVIIGAALGGLFLSTSQVAELAVVYPFDGSLFPRDIASPTLVWEDESGAVEWRIVRTKAERSNGVS